MCTLQILCVNFFWHSIFGYAMLLAGLINGLTIGITMGRPPSVAAYRLAMSISAVSIALQALSIILVLLFTFDVRSCEALPSLNLYVITSINLGISRCCSRCSPTSTTPSLPTLSCHQPHYRQDPDHVP